MSLLAAYFSVAQDLDAHAYKRNQGFKVLQQLSLALNLGDDMRF